MTVANSMNNDTSTFLAGRARSYLDQIMQVACGPSGLFISHSRFDTRRPFQMGEDYSGYWEQALRECWNFDFFEQNVPDWFYGENTLWVTGQLLWSQIIRYRLTCEPEAMAIARKCFRDLNHCFDMSRAFEPGLLGKPHGGKGGATTSFDQSAIPVLMYVMFAKEMATPEERAIAEKNMFDHGEYYIRNKWVVNHHGYKCKIVEPGHTSTMKYLACLHAAYELTGEKRFRDETIVRLRQLKAEGQLPWASRPYEIQHNMFYWGMLADYWSRTEAADVTDWKAHVAEYWRAVKKAIEPDGAVLAGMYDPDADTFTPYPDRWLPAGKSGLPIWQSARSYAGRAMVTAYTGVFAMIVADRGIDENAAPIGLRILNRLDDQTLRQWWDAGTLPPALKPLTNMFAAEVPAIWSIAYWMGRSGASKGLLE